MGILSNLFKNTEKETTERAETRPTDAMSAFPDRTTDVKTPAEPGGAPPAQEETADPARKNITPGMFKESQTRTAPAEPETVKGAAPAPAGIKSRRRRLAPVKTAEIPEKQIAIEIEDVLAQIPGDLLKAERAKAPKKPLLFNTYELLPGLSQGKPTAPVARIAELAPEIFNGKPVPADLIIELPTKKIVAQIGVFPVRPDQVDEIYPPLDARYANLILEKGVAQPAPAPVAAEQTAMIEQIGRAHV